MELIITALFGLESLVREDLEAIGYAPTDIAVHDGAVILTVPDTDIASAVARVNLWVRRGERVLVSAGVFDAQTFDEFFDGISMIRWEDFIPESYAFHVDGYSRKSKLFAIPACQGVCKKAIVKRLLRARGRSETARLNEDPTVGIVKISFGIVSDRVRMMIDTSGDPLHKRGYRPTAGAAPLRETLAAGLVSLSRYTPYEKEALVDPFCGSGTIVIEAAMLGHQIAPGLKRAFRAERWPVVGKEAFNYAREEARSRIIRSTGGEICFFGSDVDSQAIDTALSNAAAAGVSDYVRFVVADASAQTPEALREWTGYDRQLIIANPPYGERMQTPQESAEIFARIASTYLDAQGYCRDGIRLSVISPSDTFEEAAMRRADKRRKLYNGEICCQMTHYFRRAGDRR
ncbi:MAG: class I SAM-dependent RNA methyltransferase [Clostridiaceae bacterium]|jgi:putative N6-adenine-specific DNA methylase|nr:class I SAM-dependent RNA methyltransferase [Oscillospiraceae bacterium]NLO62451.1 class I SAM-dependent RNA methyltransferase [Clostridiaceae bacterium]